MQTSGKLYIKRLTKSTEKNQHLMRNLISRLFFAIGIFLSVACLNPTLAQSVVKVGAGEYLTVYLMTNKTVGVSSQSTITPILTTYPGLDSIVDVQGGQYHVTALDEQGKVFKLNRNAGFVMTTVDEFGNAFTGNFQVKGFWQCNVSLRGSDSSLWYWGIADPMNYRAGANINAPIKLNMPTGRKFKKVETGASSTLNDSYILALATDNTVWRYSRNNPTPVQITVAGETFQDIATLGGNAQVLHTVSNKLFAAGSLSSYVGTVGNSGIFREVTSAWTIAGMTFPIKELVGNSNTLHIIDANDHMFGSGTNVQGEVGTGVEYSPYRIAGPQGGVFGYGFSNGLLLTPPTQIQGKFKNINTSTTITFYLYAQDMGDNWYSWGRNKAFALGNGSSLGPYAGWGGIGDYAAYPNAMDVPMPKRVNPGSVVWTLQNFDPLLSIPPVVGAGINQYISVTATTLYGKAFQQEHTIASQTWTKIAGPAGGTIISPNSLTTGITSLQTGVYLYQLSATNSNGQTSTDDVSIIVNTGNISPTANAGSDVAITLPTNTTALSGSGTDTDGSISAYQWTKISGPVAGTITNPTAAITSATAMVQGVYQIELRVTDNNGATSRDTMQVTVNSAANQAPTANAGSDVAITLPTNTTALNGSGTDTDGSISAYQWTKISGPVAGTITNPTAGITSATALVQGVYQIELTVTDNNGATGRDTMQITVNSAANQVPTANAGSDVVITLPTNTSALSGSGTDTDGSITAYQWTKISGPIAGTITNLTAAITSGAGLVQGVYRFELRVTDNNGATGRDTVQVTVNAAVPPVNQAPTANAGLDANITLPTNTSALSGSGTDTDGSITAYQWTKITGPLAGNVTTPTAAVTSATGLVEGVYRFELRVTDNNGATDRDTMQITVNPAVRTNQAPVADAGGSITIYLPEDSATLSGSGYDMDGIIISYKWKMISAAGNYYIRNPNVPQGKISGLQQGIYTVELAVTDDRGATSYDTTLISVGSSRQAVSSEFANVYPNPVSNTLNVEIESTVADEAIAMLLYDARGVLVYRQLIKLSGNTKLETIDMTAIKAGIHFLQINYANKKQVVKRIVRL